ncbi:rhodanese-like domain-containing protein [Sporosarcina sp. PTS2304]|uniref:rhodanese-like domain-containing protein n=1 Tax=Sporosarcina sp. PTS2304 TaxID=2283194 RepID=UPI000E0DF0D5|nr:rhodanese-like domain-containing protein [Sporosarcina sp. PTS2304]AXH99711.1 rhodanese-like domain-containing protein [Sporosarcina sp. PTS2304]
MTGWILFALVIVFFIWRMKPAKGVHTISTDELKGLLKDKKIQFIDVRTPGEYKGRKIKDFQNIPLNVLNSKLASLKKDQEVVIICQSGMRSSKAAGQLKKAGFTNVTNVRGGMSAWRD